MPKISEFYGIRIFMYHNEHAPPHFHARYGGHKAWIAIDPVEVSRGSLPTPQLRVVLMQAQTYQRELRDNWDEAGRQRALARIEPWR